MRIPGPSILALLLTVASGCGATVRPAADGATVPVGSLAPAPASSVAEAPDPTPPDPDDAYADEVDGLIMRLFNEDDAVRVEGARELAALGRHAGPAVPFLRDCQRQQDGASATECADAADYIEGLETATARR